LTSRPPIAYTLSDQKRLTRAKRYFQWQRDLVLKEVGQHVVEVGCGLGNFTEFLLKRPQAATVIALDVEQGCVDTLLERFRDSPGLRALTMDVTSCQFRELARFSPDSCVCLNVLEHVEDDRLAMENMAAVLPRGGRIVLIVPAYQGLYGPIDRNLGHLRRYSKASLRALATEASLTVLKLHYMNMVGALGWWINAHVLKRQAQSERQIAFFDDWFVPPMRRLEAAVHPPCGQSLFAVLERER
jgi:ubiquinone/menaquinone biosynthesis C-methylase UbiE